MNFAVKGKKLGGGAYMEKKFKIKLSLLLVSLGLGIFGFFNASDAEAATLSLSPSSGTFEVGSTFDVNIFINTEGQTVNTISANLRFPPDALQVVSSSAGQSVIGIWVTSPGYDNANGTVELTGGIPGGLNTTNGLVSTITFRAKRPGNAFVQFLDSSDVLLHDGQGTSALRQTQNGVYTLILPPPAGPIVASETHPDQTKWYINGSIILTWTHEEDVQGYSYVLDREPVTISDNISQGTSTGAIYKNVADGTYFFHIKALRAGVWGGTTHFAVNVDTTPPVEFPIEITPEAKTTVTRPIISFTTTDAHSGVERYEIKIVPLQGDTDPQKFFIEVSSPYAPEELLLGTYDVIVRAYDRAGNYREVVQRLEITTPLFKIVSDKGLEIRGTLIIPWWLLFLLLLLLLGITGFVAWIIYRQHQIAEANLSGRAMPADVQKKLEELNKYRQKYGNVLVILLALASLLLPGSSALAQEESVFDSTAAQAENVLIAPPIITTISKNISNEEVFYAGGQVEASGMNVVLFLQNMTTGETISATVETDQRGGWFYRHDSFLPAGRYLLWGQSRLGEQTSPPSPQVQITVHTTALQFGSSRISYEALFSALALIMILANAGLVAFIWHHRKNARRKHDIFLKEVREAEESVRRGFAVLRSDIQAELDTIKKAKVGKELSGELKAREKQLMDDLGEIEHKVGKEVWDVERAEHTD
ncbi:MAG: cohesin domain-containing protein [Candidatus Spechtbacterales bacterium]